MFHSLVNLRSHWAVFIFVQLCFQSLYFKYCLCSTRGSYSRYNNSIISLCTDDLYLQKFTKCSFTLKMPKSSSHQVVALTEDSAVVLMENLCSKLGCGSLFQLNKSRPYDNTTCFHQCYNQHGLLRNCTLNHSNCTLISKVVCGKKPSQNKVASCFPVSLVISWCSIT